jgi:hypothetical protein
VLFVPGRAAKNAGSLMLSRRPAVLRILNYTNIVSSDERLRAYVERCTARPAFKRALDAPVPHADPAGGSVEHRCATKDVRRKTRVRKDG